MGKFRYNDEKYDEALSKEEQLRKYKRDCKCCGWNNLLIDYGKVLQKKNCWNCGKPVYLDNKYEFKEKLEIARRMKNENNYYNNKC